MKANKRVNLEKAGWHVGTADEFLGLSAEESAYIDMKLALSDALKKTRIKKRMSQVVLAERIASSQSRVAKMESGDSSVSIDLLVKSLLALGATQKDVAKALGS